MGSQTAVPDLPEELAPIFRALQAEGLVTRTFLRLAPERQAAVMTAILEEAAGAGPAALSVKRVAARAGIAVGSLYQYFPDRDGLLAFAAEAAGRYLVQSLSAYRDELAAVPLREGLAYYVAGGLEWTATMLPWLRCFARAAYLGDSPEMTERLVRPAARCMVELIRALLEAAVARGELDPGIDLEVASRFVHAQTILVADVQLLPHLGAYLQVLPEDRPVTDGVEAFLETVLRALPAPPRRDRRGGRR